VDAPMREDLPTKSRGSGEEGLPASRRSGEREGERRGDIILSDLFIREKIPFWFFILKIMIIILF
jgi:hypothetical protein